MTAVAKREEAQIVEQPNNALTPMDLIERATSAGATPDTLEKLMALQERWEKNQARKAFDAAIAEAKSKIPIIKKNRHVGFESKKAGAARTDYAHEDMAEIARTVNPILGAHGLSYRYRTTSNLNEPVTVTCILSHRDGHSEETTLSAGRDETGNKNSIQAVGSTVTFLQRYTLKAALGLAAAEDDDGRTSGAAGQAVETINQAQIDNLRELLESTGAPKDKFLRWAKVEKIEQIEPQFYDSCIEAIKRAGK